jgi:adenine-specific DNA-methyltransferase
MVRQILGNPTWESASLLVYQGDSIELMQRLPGDLFDLTVTSPPYNIGKEYEQTLPVEAYLSWCETWINEVFRLTDRRGAFWLNLGYISLSSKAKAIPLPYLLWNRIPFFLVQEIVWNYGAGVAGRRFFSPRNEKWLWCVKDETDYVFNLDAVRDPNVKYPNQRKNGRIRVNRAGKNPTDVWQIPKVTTGDHRTGQRASIERTSHPSQFPEAVIERIILASSNPGGLVFDPFGGSGTTAAVAARTGRECIIFELLPEYVTMATHRLKKMVAKLAAVQPSLMEQLDNA